jgi:hypothetical protein
MTQALYAHMNNKTIKIFFKKNYRRLKKRKNPIEILEMKSSISQIKKET